MSSANKPYISHGQVLESPPLTARLRNFVQSLYIFLGLYVVTLFSADAYSAAENSKFNIQRPSSNTPGRRPGWGGGGSGRGSGDGKGGGGGGGGGWSGGGSGGGPKRLGRVDDVRGPECGSCQ